MDTVSSYFCKRPKPESQLLNLYKFAPLEIYVELKGFNKSTDSICRRARLDKTASINFTGKSERASRNGSFMDYDWWILQSLLAMREDCIKACSYYWQNLDIFMNPLWYHTNSPQNDFICPVAGPHSACHIRFASNSGQLQLASPLIACLGPVEFHFLKCRHSPLLLLSVFFAFYLSFLLPALAFTLWFSEQKLMCWKTGLVSCSLKSCECHLCLIRLCAGGSKATWQLLKRDEKTSGDLCASSSESTQTLTARPKYFT